MTYRIFPILLFSLFTQTCMSEKTCSNQDRTCSPIANLLSFVSAPEGLYLYSTSARNGNLAILGAGTLDSSLHTICSQERPFVPIIDFGCQNVAPFIATSVVGANNLTSLYADIPTNIPVRGPSGTIVSDDLPSVFSLDLKTSFSNAGISNSSFWAFADAAGNFYAANSCNNGEDNTGSYAGYVGSPTIVAFESWYGGGVGVPCSESHPIICICYRPVASGG